MGWRHIQPAVASKNDVERTRFKGWYYLAVVFSATTCQRANHVRKNSILPPLTPVKQRAENSDTGMVNRCTNKAGKHTQALIHGGDGRLFQRYFVQASDQSCVKNQEHEKEGQERRAEANEANSPPTSSRFPCQQGPGSGWPVDTTAPTKHVKMAKKGVTPQRCFESQESANACEL